MRPCEIRSFDTLTVVKTFENRHFKINNKPSAVGYRGKKIDNMLENDGFGRFIKNNEEEYSDTFVTTGSCAEDKVAVS